jgi:glycosyltransferase involved in cell wall biosynthesis
MLFLGSFRHKPNDVGVRWFLREVMPRVLAEEPEATFTVIGSDPPAIHTVPTYDGAVKLVGFVEDLAPAMREHAVFVCPILAGSGLRVKLLEAFSSGIPVVSTRVGAEGLGEQDGLHCRLAASAEEFAAKILEVFRNGEEAARMAARARDYVARERDMARITRELELTYRKSLSSKGS